MPTQRTRRIDTSAGISPTAPTSYRGRAYLDGEDIARMSARELAVKIGILAQSPVATPGLTVASLVAYGRYPHQRWFQQWSPEDERVVNEALTTTKMLEFADRPLDELSEKATTACLDRHGPGSRHRDHVAG